MLFLKNHANLAEGYDHSARDIAKKRKPSNKTISFELRCCTPYCPKEAHEKAQSLRKNTNKAFKCNDKMVTVHQGCLTFCIFNVFQLFYR